MMLINFNSLNLQNFLFVDPILIHYPIIHIFSLLTIPSLLMSTPFNPQAYTLAQLNSQPQT